MNEKICICGHKNAGTEDFCVACGAELSTTTTHITDDRTLHVVDNRTDHRVDHGILGAVQSQPAARTITIGDKSYPLYAGTTVTIARGDSDQNPEIKLDDDSVSGTPLELVVDDAGKLSVRYSGAQEKPYSVVKNIKPGQTVEVDPGEMLMIGNLVGIVV